MRSEPIGVTDSDPAIEAHALTKRYGERIGIDGVSLSVPRGSMFGFIGPNGAGKTTTIRVLLGFLAADAGHARVLRRDCWRDSRELKRDVGYVPGDLRLHAWMSGVDALRFCGGARGCEMLAPGRRLADLLELDLAVRVRAMSRGMRQKLGLILALAHEPQLLVLDEPTSALDPLTQVRLFRHLRELAGRGHTVFFSSHVLSEVEDLCDRVAIIRAGRIVADERLAALREAAGRTVTIRWADGAAPDTPPPFLELWERDGRVWHCGLRGPVPPLLAWLDRRPVADLAIGPPDLDRLFMRYYEAPER